MIKFLLFDAHSIIFRSYFAFIKNPLRNTRGDNTSGIFGFLNTIEKVRKRIPTDWVSLIFDAPGETFRDRIFKEYKATRPAPPKDIPFQVAMVKKIVRYLGNPIFEIEGYEADDILATLATRLKKIGDVYIVSSDKDLLQLVSKNIYLYDAYQEIIYDEERVKEKFGIPPERISDYLALVGDTTDNIPGVPGIGHQRAVEILEKYQTLEEAISNDKRLVENENLLRLSKRLTSLDCNVPVEIDIQQLKSKEPQFDKLMPILIDLELYSFIKELTKDEKLDLRVVEAKDIANLGFENILSIHYMDGKFFISGADGVVYKVIPKAIEEKLKKENFLKVGYNLKELIKIFNIEPPIFDLQIAAWLIDPNAKSYRFEDIAIKYLFKYLEPQPEFIAAFGYELYFCLKKKLEELDEFELYKKIEEPLIYVLARMEKRGIKIDIPYLRSLGSKIEREMVKISEEIYRLAGKRFNINSPRQLAKILFEDLKLTPIKKKKTQYSTDLDVLQELSLRHPLPKEIMKFRELSKVVSTYIEPLISLARDSRIHTTFNQTGTATGRLSSLNPNIQNIPIKTALGRELRRAFCCEEDFLLLSADYSQVELRILAHITNDKNLIKAFNENRDIHNHTASLVFKIPLDAVSEEQRRIAKIVNYGLIYGMSEYGLAQGLDIPQEKAMEFIQTYYTLYPDIDGWRQKAIEFVMENGYTKTLLGRRRPIPGINSANKNVKEAAKRAAINTPIQGTAADLIKLAMIEVEKRLNEAGFKSGLLLSIHDELLFEIERERIEEAKSIIKEAMENILKLEVPLEVKLGVGKNWAETH